VPVLGNVRFEGERAALEAKLATAGFTLVLGTRSETGTTEIPSIGVALWGEEPARLESVAAYSEGHRDV
jgi:hypothetical protein